MYVDGRKKKRRRSCRDYKEVETGARISVGEEGKVRGWKERYRGKWRLGVKFTFDFL